MDKFFKPCANKELVYLKAPASCSQAPAPSKKNVKASTNGTSEGLAGWLKQSGGESSPSNKEATASALENGDGCPAIADGLPAIADGPPAIDHDVSMEPSSSNAPARGKRTEASAFNAPPIDYTVRCARCKRACDPCTDQMIRFTKKAMGPTP